MSKQQIFILICAPVVAALLSFALSSRFDAPSPEDQHELNYLNSSLYDFAHPTPLNKTMREIACQDAGNKAARYLQLKGAAIPEKVRQYLEYCDREGK